MHHAGTEDLREMVSAHDREVSASARVAGMPPLLRTLACTVPLVLLTASRASPEEVEKRTLKVFVLAGQSNMQGQGVVDLDHPQHYNGGKGTLLWAMQHSASREEMQHLRDLRNQWIVRDDVFVRYQTDHGLKKGGLTVGFTGYEGDHHIGPELQFGHVVGDHFQQPVLLIKTCWGGKSLHREFRPPGAGGETGEAYRKMLREVADALASIRTDFPSLNFSSWELAGFVWMQGWNDMIDEQARNEYADNLVHLAADVRRELNAPNLPFVVGELGNGGPAQPGSGMHQFRAAQRLGTGRIENARFVVTYEFARPAKLSPNTGHGHHWYGNAESYFLMGDALGQAMISLIGE